MENLAAVLLAHLAFTGSVIAFYALLLGVLFIPCYVYVVLRGK